MESLESGRCYDEGCVGWLKANIHDCGWEMGSLNERQRVQINYYDFSHYLYLCVNLCGHVLTIFR